MKKLMEILMGAVKHYTPADFAIFKIFMVSIGVLFGVYFAPILMEYMPYVWGVAIVGVVVVVGQLIRYALMDRERQK